MPASHKPRRDAAFVLQLSAVSRRWRAALDSRLRHTGLTQARWSALVQISRAGEALTQRELAVRIGVEGPTIGRLLDGLERQGLVERRAVRGDRRAHHTHLTAAARPLLKEITAIADGLRGELLAGIPAREIEVCTSVLARIAGRLEKS